jgi:transporter family protein
MAAAPEPQSESPGAKVAGLDRWLFFSLLTIMLWGLWGLVSKIASESIDAETNQVYFAIGMLPIIVVLSRSPRLKVATNRKAGIAWAFLTGLLGGAGNIAFFQALVVGGRVSVIIPVTALFPLITVILAMLFLHERIGRVQRIGLGLALVAMYILSTAS